MFVEILQKRKKGVGGGGDVGGCAHARARSMPRLIEVSVGMIVELELSLLFE